MADRFYIGMLDGNASLQTSLKPFAIPDNAFAELNNAYVWRGRVRKRFGSKLMVGTTPPTGGFEQLQSRLRINIGPTNGSGNFSGSAIGTLFKVGQAFSVGDQIFTVYQLGTPASMLSTGTATGTYDTTSGAVVITGAAATTAVYFYPADSVMGLPTYENVVLNVEDTLAFDTQFAYIYGNTGWEQAGAAVWHGSNSNFFWSVNSRAATANSRNLFTSNFYVASTLPTISNSDPIRRWDGSSWTDFTPSYTSGANTQIWTARCMILFKNRLVLFNTWESNGSTALVQFQNRIRFSKFGSPVDANSFYVTPTLPTDETGGFLDLPTTEAIVTVQSVKDRIIIYCERSTWELVFQSNQVNPFTVQKIDTELGAESTFSQVPFDKVVLGIGNVGIHACDGYAVERIDDKIPTTVFNIHNDNDGVKRVYGIRDYFTEMIYWSMPTINRDANFPYNNQVLTYNYKNGSWAFNEDSITAFGYFQTVLAGTSTSPLWKEVSDTWEECSFAWNGAVSQAKFRHVMGGNQQGWTFVIDPTITVNSQALQITNISYTSVSVTVTSINHNLSVGDYIKFQELGGISGLNEVILKVDSLDGTTPQNIFTCLLGTIIVTGSYVGGGTLGKVTPINFKTKQFNFYANKGYNVYVSRVDFLVNRTTSGQCTVDYYVSSSDDSMLTQAALTGALTGNSILETTPYALIPFESQQVRLWHPVYLDADGEYVQLQLLLTDAQAMNASIAESDFELHAMIFSAQPTSSRLQ